MYHSITFDNGVETKNTWDDWSLVPSSRPVFAPPEPKTKTIDIPGGDGVLDLTESLTGYPVYNNRTGSIEFAVINQWYQGSKLDNEAKWIDTYSEVMSFVHGRQLKAYLEDDPDHYYEGRFTVSDWQSGSYISAITIDYDVGPYRWNNSTNTLTCTPTSANTWQDFQQASPLNFNNWCEEVSRAPVCPEITISGSSSGAQIRAKNDGVVTAEANFTANGTYQDPGLTYFGKVVYFEVYMRASGGSAKFTWRGGWF